MAEERELVFRSLALTGLHIVVSLSSIQGTLHLSEGHLGEQEVQEIHVVGSYKTINNRLEEIGFKFKGIIKGWNVFAKADQVLHHPGFKGSFECMDVVQLNLSYGNSPAGTLAFVLEVDDYKRATLITKNDDMIHMVEREQIDHLIYMSSNNSFKEFKKS